MTDVLDVVTCPYKHDENVINIVKINELKTTFLFAKFSYKTNK